MTRSVSRRIDYFLGHSRDACAPIRRSVTLVNDFVTLALILEELPVTTVV